MPGGSVKEVHVAGRSFTVAADSDGNRDLGGMSVEMQMNGDLTARAIQTAKPWMMDGLALAINDSNGDQEFLQEKVDLAVEVPIAFLLAGNVIYSGTGLPTGDIKMSTQNITMPLSFSGGGVLRRQQ